MNNEGLDKLDIAILNILKDNARMSYSEIGEKVGVTRVAVKNRMNILEREGVIKGYKAIIDETSIPEGITFILDVECIPEEYENVVNDLTRYRFLRQVYSTTGDCRLHCVGFVPNRSTLDHHVNYLFRSIKGIRKMSWHMLLSTLKNADGGVEDDKCKEPEHMESGGK